jgi:ferric-dicitrate binding protein FerR (iron transport regulator)
MDSETPFQFPSGDAARDERLLDRYLAGECTVREREVLDAWVEANPDASARITALRHTARYPEKTPALRSSTERWTAFQSRIHSTATDQVHVPLQSTNNLQKIQKTHRGTAWRTWGIASTVAVVAMCLTTWFIRHPESHVSHDTATVYVTPRGGRAKILLSDGTSVMLNVASRLEIPQQFDKHRRIVRLHGEAVFHVARTVGAPFIVDAGAVQARVLGTEFSVRAYQPRDVRVAVRTGKVAVDTTVLSAHDIAQTATSGQVQVARNQDVDAAFAFTQGRLVVVSHTLRSVLDDLDRWYDVDIHLGDPAIGNMPIDAVLLSGSIGDLSGFLQRLYDVRVVRDGRTLTLYRR